MGDFGIPDEFEDPLEAPWICGGDHCGKETEDEETAGEAAEREVEETVVKSLALKDSDEPLGLLVELWSDPEELSGPADELADVPGAISCLFDEIVEAVDMGRD